MAEVGALYERSGGNPNRLPNPYDPSKPFPARLFNLYKDKIKAGWKGQQAFHELPNEMIQAVMEQMDHETRRAFKGTHSLAAENSNAYWENLYHRDFAARHYGHADPRVLTVEEARLRGVPEFCLEPRGRVFGRMPLLRGTRTRTPSPEGEPSGSFGRRGFVFPAIPVTTGDGHFGEFVTSSEPIPNHAAWEHYYFCTKEAVYGLKESKLTDVPEWMFRLNALKELNLDGNTIDEHGAADLAAALPKLSLTRINLNGNSIGVEGAEALAATLPTSLVTHIELGRNQISDEGVKVLAAALPTSLVTHINLRRNQISVEGAKALAEALPTSLVTHIELGRNSIGVEGAKALAEALPTSLVTHIDLSRNSIGVEGAKALAEALPTSLVTHIELFFISIGAEGAKALAEALPNSMIDYIDLGGNNIGVEGAKALAAALPASLVTHIELFNSSIGAEGAKALAEALPNSMIDYIELRGNYIAGEAEAALKEVSLLFPYIDVEL